MTLGDASKLSDFAKRSIADEWKEEHEGKARSSQDGVSCQKAYIGRRVSCRAYWCGAVIDTGSSCNEGPKVEVQAKDGICIVPMPATRPFAQAQGVTRYTDVIFPRFRYHDCARDYAFLDLWTAFQKRYPFLVPRYSLSLGSVITSFGGSASHYFPRAVVSANSGVPLAFALIRGGTTTAANIGVPRTVHDGLKIERHKGAGVLSRN
jgi:hypothetical protein